MGAIEGQAKNNDGEHSIDRKDHDTWNTEHNVMIIQAAPVLSAKAELYMSSRRFSRR